MRTLVQIFISLSLLACFTAAAANCSMLDNDKSLCTAASSLCTWTDDPAKDSCIDICPIYRKVDTDCTSQKGCAFTASTCSFKTTCSDQGKDTCTAANNCVLASSTCQFNPAVEQVCSVGGACVDPLPSYCVKINFLSCAFNEATTNTCPQGVSQYECIPPCQNGEPVATCTSICAGLTQTNCLAASTSCSWANNTCGLKDGLADCSTVVSTCSANPQCVAQTVFNCSTTAALLNIFCTPATPGIACSATQAGWCSTKSYNDCLVNSSYCDLGKDGNLCNIDTTNCIPTGYNCTILDNKACTWSQANPTCNPNLCNYTESSCTTTAPGGCQLNKSACTSNDDNCIYSVGGTCTNILSSPEQKDSQK